MLSECSCFSLPDQFLGSEGMLSSLTSMVWYLVCTQMLVGLLARRGTKVGNNLCCCLDNVIPFPLVLLLLLLSFKNPYAFLLLVLYQIYVLQIFSPSFHLLVFSQFVFSFSSLYFQRETVLLVVM